MENCEKLDGTSVNVMSIFMDPNTTQYAANITNINNTDNEHCRKHYYYIGFYAFIFLAATSGNGFVLLVIYKFQELWTRANYLIATLASADLAAGISTLLLLIGCFIISSGRMTLIAINLMIFVRNVGVMTIVMIAVERYIAVLYPLRYNLYVTETSLKSAICLAWTVPLVVSIVMLIFGSDKNTTLNFYILVALDTGLSFFAPSAAIMVMYMKILGVVWLQTRQIYDMNHQKQNASASVKRIRATITLGTISGVFICCWMPGYVDMSYSAYVHGLWEMRTVFVGIGMLNCCINPIIYASSIPQFRKAFARLFGRKAETAI